MNAKEFNEKEKRKRETLSLRCVSLEHPGCRNPGKKYITSLVNAISLLSRQ